MLIFSLSRLAALALVLVHSLPSSVLAQTEAYPARSVRFIVPFSAGGATDVAARMIADGLAKRWGKPVIVENRPGGGSVIGSQAVAQADPDGYMLLFGPNSGLIENSLLMRRLPYDPIKSFAPVAEIYGISAGLSITTKLPSRTLVELLDLARRQPLTYSSFGVGSGPHLLLETLKRTAGVDIAHVPYKGGTEGIAAVVAGDVHMTGAGLGTIRPFTESGQMRLLAVAGEHQTKFAPGVPTFKELGYDAVAGGSLFVGLWAPAGTPSAVITTISEGVAAELATPEFGGYLDKFAYFPPGGKGPEHLAKLMRNSLDTWTPMIKSLGIEIGK